MSGMNCYHCGATTSNGLALCDLCQRKAATIFEFLPVYFRNLARWRPGRAGSRPVPGSRVLYDGTVRGAGTGDRISDALDETATMLVTWAESYADDRIQHAGPRPLTLDIATLTADLPPEIVADDQPQVVAWLCASLEHHLTSVATLEWCGEFLRELDQHEARLRALTETWIPGWYAGACQRRISLEAKCGADTYVVPGLTWVTCPACGSTTYARDHLEAIIDEAADWIARPKALSTAIVALVDTEQSITKVYTRIRQWAHQGDLAPIHHTARDHVWSEELQDLIVADVEIGPARYRFGDVLDRILHGVSRAAKSEAS